MFDKIIGCNLFETLSMDKIVAFYNLIVKMYYEKVSKKVGLKYVPKNVSKK